MMAAQMSMNDYRMIRAHGHPLTADMLLAMHNSQLDQIRKLVAVAPGDCVVVTHHAPSLQSIHSKYKRADLVSLNGAFVSDYDQLITDELTKVKVWCHGHTHDAFDYSVGATRVVCNPVGYPSERKSNGFKSEKAVLVE
jgi:predicted phosphodiesterase